MQLWPLNLLTPGPEPRRARTFRLPQRACGGTVGICLAWFWRELPSAWLGRELPGVWRGRECLAPRGSARRRRRSRRAARATTLTLPERCARGRGRRRGRRPHHAPRRLASRESPPQGGLRRNESRTVPGEESVAIKTTATRREQKATSTFYTTQPWCDTIFKQPTKRGRVEAWGRR